MLRAALILLIVLLPVYALTYSSGPPAKRTGAPGDQTCQSGCHNSFGLNSGTGGVSISTAEQYRPGETLSVTVQVNGSASRWGFELTVQDANDAPVGTLTAGTDGRTGAASGNTDYIAHTTSGTAADSWTFSWTAPDTDVGSVTMYAAGVAANGNGSNSGDHVYTTSTTLGAVATALGDDVPASFTLLGNAPNPFRDVTHVRFSLEAPAAVTLVIYDALGREVRRMPSGSLGIGRHTLPVSADGLPAGVYHYELRTPRERHSRTFVVQK